jgi:hypothetical protein
MLGNSRHKKGPGLGGLAMTEPTDIEPDDEQAMRPEDCGEPADAPSAVHGDFHHRPPTGDEDP